MKKLNNFQLYWKCDEFLLTNAQRNCNFSFYPYYVVAVKERTFISVDM